jgi:hypothetical protein
MRQSVSVFLRLLLGDKQFWLERGDVMDLVADVEQNAGNIEPNALMGCCASARARKPNVRVSGPEWEGM